MEAARRCVWGNVPHLGQHGVMAVMCHGEMPPDNLLMVTGEHNRQRRHANKISQENLRRTPHPMLAH